MKETYENMELLLKGINYSKYVWKKVGDLRSHRVTPNNAVWLHKICCYFVNGQAEQKTNITKLRIGPRDKTQFQGESTSEINR
jgi:hypothetical protein